MWKTVQRSNFAPNNQVFPSEKSPDRALLVSPTGLIWNNKTSRSQGEQSFRHYLFIIVHHGGLVVHEIAELLFPFAKRLFKCGTAFQDF